MLNCQLADSLEVGMISTLHQHKGGRLRRREVGASLGQSLQSYFAVKGLLTAHAIDNYVDIVSLL